ncbi:ABC transporter substrate-binding protein [Sulfurospirillum arcachonense]|uniref:ABC transporter substrate-binding protein n=1 Tax=Sulfurospirillum arcachonense TaxID=57666 RepID=UPI00046A8A75|nr:ABC transporter substrate-binding protein [Sulfurospirillum arcachonense]
MACFYFYNQPKKVSKIYKIGILSHARVLDMSLKGFKDGLKSFGYSENQNIKYYYDGATNDISKLPNALQKLLDKNVDMILSLGTPASIQAQKGTKINKIPVLFAPASNPIASGLVKSISSPGENVTGVTFGLQEVKRLEWLLKFLPHVKKIYYPYNSKDTSPAATLKRLQKYLKGSDIEIIIADVASEEQIKKSLKNLPQDIDVVYVSTDALVASYLQYYLSVFNKLKIPISVPHRIGVEQGAFMSYGFSLYELGFQSARIAKEILEGMNPGDIPVEYSEFKLSINIDNMKELGIKIPETILKQAIIVGKDVY